MPQARGWLVVVAVALAACGKGQAPFQAPAPTLPPNQPPSVTVTGGRCHPHPDRPCSVTLTATASDPDGDPLTYSWSGCASGTGPAAGCVLTTLGAFRATVEVRDGKGASAVASAEVLGVNEAPQVQYSDTPRGPLWVNGIFYAEGRVLDPDGDEDNLRLCQGMLVTGSGSCRAARSGCVWESCGGHPPCGGVAYFAVDIRTVASSGTCTVEAAAWDSWGDPASVRLVYEVR